MEKKDKTFNEEEVAGLKDLEKIAVQNLLSDLELEGKKGPAIANRWLDNTLSLLKNNEDKNGFFVIEGYSSYGHNDRLDYKIYYFHTSEKSKKYCIEIPCGRKEINPHSCYREIENKKRLFRRTEKQEISLHEFFSAYIGVMKEQADEGKRRSEIVANAAKFLKDRNLL